MRFLFLPDRTGAVLPFSTSKYPFHLCDFGSFSCKITLITQKLVFMEGIMKKGSRKRQEQVEAQIKLLFLIPAIIIFYFTKSIAQTIGMMIPIAILIFGILILYRFTQNQILKNSGINEIDKMDGERFERYLNSLYKSLGYQSELTKRTGDFGADLILTKDRKRIVVQAKRYSNNVGIKAVQEANSARSLYHAVESWVVTNSYFTKAAITLAESNSVKLINRDQLIKLILSVKKTG